MQRQIASLSVAAILTVFAAGAIDTSAQSGLGRGAQPPPPGQRIQANDGDVVLIEGDARVRIVRRRAANARAIYDQDQQWFLLLADYVPPKGGKPNGTVDATYMFRALHGNWPFDARWEGPVVIEDYVDTDFPPVSGGVGIVFPFGLVQFFAMPKSPDLYVMSSAVAVLRYGGGGRSAGGYASFDLAEAGQVENLRRVTQINAGLARGPGSGFIRIETVPATGTADVPQQSVHPSGEQAPIRVGGSVRPPQRIHYVEAAYRISRVKLESPASSFSKSSSGPTAP